MVQNNFHPARTRQTDTPLPLLGFCSNWLGNAILPGKRPSLTSSLLAWIYNRFRCAQP
jgi:hypothetical protein